MAAGAYQAWLPRDADIYGAGTISIPESASLVGRRGTPGLWDSNGRAAACTTAPTAIGFILAEDGHNNATAGGSNVLVWPVRVHQQWKVYLLDALTQAMQGQTLLGIVQDTVTSFWYASTADTGAQCKIIDYESGPGGMAIGDTKAPVYVEFVYAKIQIT
jgi:hypothetical protein